MKEVDNYKRIYDISSLHIEKLSGLIKSEYYEISKSKDILTTIYEIYQEMFPYQNLISPRFKMIFKDGKHKLRFMIKPSSINDAFYELFDPDVKEKWDEITMSKTIEYSSSG
jgi:hypothetical protein